MLSEARDIMSEPAPAPHQPAAADADGRRHGPARPAAAAPDVDGRERSPRRAAREQEIFQNGMIKGALTVLNRINGDVAEMTRNTHENHNVATMEISHEVRTALHRATAINKVLAQVMASAWRAVDELKP